MTQAQREQMAALMRDHLPQITAVEDMIAHDIKVLEPFIDHLVQQAENRGRLTTLLEKIAELPVDVIEHSHPCEVCGDAVSCFCPNADEGYSLCNRHLDYTPF